jgi:hypothetical protein
VRSPASALSSIASAHSMISIRHRHRRGSHARRVARRFCALPAAQGACPGHRPPCFIGNQNRLCLPLARSQRLESSCGRTQRAFSRFFTTVRRFIAIGVALLSFSRTADNLSSTTGGARDQLAVRWRARPPGPRFLEGGHFRGDVCLPLLLNLFAVSASQTHNKGQEPLTHSLLA